MKTINFLPKAVKTQCGEAPVIPNGRATTSPGRLEIVCDEGYRTETTHLNCLNGEWNLVGIEVETICKPASKPCPPPPSVTNAVIMEPYQKEYLSESSVTYECRKDYMINGGETIRCNDGAWEKKTISCVRHCKNLEDGKLTIRSDVKETYKEGESINYKCNAPGEVIEGTASCSNGLWSKSIECPAVPCLIGGLPTPLGIAGDPPTTNQVPGGQTLRFYCPDEYYLEGAAEIECSEAGEWKESFPTCSKVTCSRNLPEDNLSWGTTRDTQGRNRLGDTVGYGCKWYYERTDGAQHATCTRDGWTPKPLCRVTSAPCPHPDFENAVITYGVKDSYNRNDQVRYRCQTGNGETFTATCREGAWTESTGCAASCPPPDFQDADITHGAKYNYISGDQVQYRCRSGNRETFSAICKEGTWAEANKCAVCKIPPIEHGFAVGPFNNKAIYYSCNENYKLSAKSWWDEATCVDGEWSALHPCIVKTQCGEAPVIPNGRATTSPGRLEIVCDEGYRTETTHLNCLNGEWNLVGIEVETICKPASKPCQPPPSVTNAVIMEPYQKEYLSESSVTYECRKGYMINGGETIRCNDGAWEKKTISCVRYCENLEDGKLTIRSDVKETYMEGESINYECNAPGEVIEGTASCSNGLWSKSIECPAVPCLIGGLPTHLGIAGDPPTTNQVPGGQTLSFYCPDEYYLEGAAEIECSEAGEWKESFPTCSKKCPILVLTDNVIISEPAEGRYLRRKGEKLTFGCLRGLSITGHTTIECLNDGIWSGQPPTCETLSCTVGDLPTGLKISGDRPANNQVPGGQTLRFHCPNEYNLRGAEEIECLQTGKWKEPFPTCSSCGRPPSLTDGETVGFPKQQYENGDTVEYTCYNMYVLKGGRFKTCNNGVWTGEMRCMKPCTVNAEMRERHNIEFSRNDRDKYYAPHEDHLTFVCKHGTRLLHQEPMRKQCINGQMDLPTCG
ncbi:complement factor H-related protein 5-like [Nothobranchius furzeri]|uniref:complement factor H-related protein 5-like n=1 Tax=Nothobranchius furzeri TaxID=105023 RepID=UPI003904B839